MAQAVNHTLLLKLVVRGSDRSLLVWLSHPLNYIKSGSLF